MIQCGHILLLYPSMPLVYQITQLMRMRLTSGELTQVLRCEYVIMRFIVRVHVKPLKW